jgi:hypothetical protein
MTVFLLLRVRGHRTAALAAGGIRRRCKVETEW